MYMDNHGKFSDRDIGGLALTANTEEPNGGSKSPPCTDKQVFRSGWGGQFTYFFQVSKILTDFCAEYRLTFCRLRKRLQLVTGA